MPTPEQNIPLTQEDVMVAEVKTSRKSKEAQFTKRLMIYLTEPQYKMLEQRNKNYGSRLGRCARETLMRGCKRRLPVDVEGKALSAVEDAIDDLRALRMVLPVRSKNGRAIDAVLRHLVVAQATIRQVKAAKATRTP